MQTSPVISNQKIIMLVVFICAAIMSSLFIFHWRSQSQLKTAQNDDAIIFPAPNQIKPFQLLTANNQAFSQDNFLNHWSLVFFGFTHCAKICPTTLDMISKVYTDLHTAYPNLQVVMVSLDPERDTPDSVMKYAQNFNPSFIGVTGKLNELRKFQSQLGIYSAKGETAADGSYQIKHTASIMLINPKGEWAGMFRFGMKPAEFKKVFEASI